MVKVKDDRVTVESDADSGLIRYDSYPSAEGFLIIIFEEKQIKKHFFADAFF